MAEFIAALPPEDKKRYYQKLRLDVGDNAVDLPDPFELEDWIDDRGQWPDTNYGCIYNYLIKTPGPYDGEALQAYKSLDAYNYFVSGHVRECLYHRIDEKLHVCFVKAKVIPGQRVTDSPHQPWVCLDKTRGYVVAAHCTCMAGLGEVCSHIAALLFTIEAAASLNENQTACTSKRAAWNLYYKKKVEVSAVEDIDLSHPRHGVDGPKRRRRQAQIIPPPLDDTEAAEALQTIKKLCPTAGICIKSPSDTDTASEDEESFVPRHPPVVYRLSTCTSQSPYDAEKVLQDAKVAPSQILNLSQDTIGQANSALWQQHRIGRITSTLMHDVLHTKTPAAVLRKVMQYDTTDLSKIAAVKWGREHENQAREEYRLFVSKRCQNVVIEETGLVLFSDLSFIGASPDGLKQCSCHTGIRVLEIKCPYKYRNFKPDCPEALSDPTYCLDSNLRLKSKHRYFTQVQTHMLVTGASSCDFIVWTQKGLVVIDIQKDVDFQQRMLFMATKFIKEYLIPEVFNHGSDAEMNCTEDQNKLYCLCKRPPFGRMIKCDNDRCSGEWFHYDCVHIKRKPKGEWLCENCKVEL